MCSGFLIFSHDGRIRAWKSYQRLDWHGSPRDLGELFILQKNGREAVCKLRSHQFGWELLLFIFCQQLEVVQTQVCRSQEDVLTTGEQWKAAMIERVGNDDRGYQGMI